MNELVRKLQKESERIASRYPFPRFYAHFKAPMALARRLFFTDPVIILLREALQPVLQDELGHGFYHSARVSVDGAALVCVELESARVDRESMERLMILALIAGLLHDIRRSEQMHAELGAREAGRILTDFPLTRQEVQCVCEAIRNHEAFTTPRASSHPLFQLVSDCLYDADKFRWGPDTFTHTLWHLMDHQGLSPQELIEKFPWGMKGLARILGTFRTVTGRQFGPEIIETGMQIGKEIYQYLLQNFGER